MLTFQVSIVTFYSVSEIQKYYETKNIQFKDVGIDNKINVEEILLLKINNLNETLQFSHQLGKFLINKNAFLAKEFLNYSINVCIKTNSNIHPDLIELFILNSKNELELGNINESYNYLNRAFIVSLTNFSYYSIEMIKCLFNFANFSKRIEEYEEFKEYYLKTILIIEYLKNGKIKNEKERIEILYYEIQLIDGLTQIGEEAYHINNLKLIDSQYLKLQKDLEIITEVNKDEDIICKIIFYNIKIKHFLKIDRTNTEDLILKLIEKIKSKYGKFNDFLVYPYIYLLKKYIRENNKTEFLKIYENDFEKYAEGKERNIKNSLINYSNYFLFLFREIIPSDTKLSNLEDFREQIEVIVVQLLNNYLYVFNYHTKTEEEINNLPKTEMNFIFSEYYYKEIYALYHLQNFATIDKLISDAVTQIQYNLGSKSNKYKNLLEISELINSNNRNKI